ncbi:MAG: hypothetical protein QOJ20_2207, partial [Mycobacterium sp.]|nr:hypothetical protein [Mycobacterium sp.]
TLLAWLIGTRVSYGWDEVKRQRESDMASLQLFYQCYGKFFAAWKMWAVYNRINPSDRPNFPADDPRAWDILRTAEDAESGFETILVKLASEYTHSDTDRQLFASFRQGVQSLREAIRKGQDLTWKAQAFSPRDGGSENPARLLEYRQYRAFKALCEYVAVTLARGPYGTRASRGRTKRLFLGLGNSRLVEPTIAIEGLIAITRTEGIGGHWWEIAEEEFALPTVPERPA